MLQEILEKIKAVDLDRGGDASDIKIKSIVKVGGQVYTCIDDMGDNYSFMLEDDYGNVFIYDAMADDITPYE